MCFCALLTDPSRVACRRPNPKNALMDASLAAHMALRKRLAAEEQAWQRMVATHEPEGGVANGAGAKHKASAYECV